MKNYLLFIVLALLLACSPQESSEGISEATLQETSQEISQTTIETTTLNSETDKVTVTSDINEKSIAILPFTDLSEQGDQSYFSDGLSEELIERLSMMPDLVVASRDASFYYKNREEVLGVIGERLKVAYILQGSVRKSNNQLRISAQLVNASDGFNLWSRSFDREITDLFEIQDEIAESVKTSLSVSLGAGEFSRSGTTNDVNAYDTILQAAALYNDFTPDSVFRAINLAEEAVHIDPEYGRGWLLLGAIYAESPLILSADQSAGFTELADRAFSQARTTGPEMPELLLVDAGARRNNNQFVQADTLYQQYFERNGYSNARANEEYAQLLARVGRVKEALEFHSKAKAIDAFSPRYSFQVAQRLLTLGRIEEALIEVEYGKSLNISEWAFNSLIWQSEAMQGNFAQVGNLIRAYYDNHKAGYGATVSERFMREYADILLINNFESSIQDISDLIERPGVTPYEIVNIARLVALLNEPGIALNFWQQQTVLPSIWDTYYSDMRQLPEFNALAEENGLAEYWRTTSEWGDYCEPVNEQGNAFTCQ